MIYLILVSALTGALITLLLQLLLLYKRNPEPAARTVQYVKAVPEPALRDYFKNIAESGHHQQDNTVTARQQDSTSSKQQEGASSTSSSSPKQQQQPSQPQTDFPHASSKSETCNFLNAIFLFLFRELRDTNLVRHWVTKKIKVEFEELLQTKTAGRLLEGLSLRDFSLGNSLPVFKTAKLIRPVSCNEDGMPEELNFEVDLEYNGGFHLAIDVEMVFGKSAYLFVKMTRVVGRLRLQFTRLPFSHWSFSFLEDPLIDFEVRSQFEGRPLPQLTSIIVNQLKRVIKRKHTLPNYKIRYKPFFPFQVQPTSESVDVDLSIQDTRIVEGRLKVTVVECSRLFILGSYDRETYVHCTVELSSSVWKEKPRSSVKTAEIIKGNSQSVGLTLRQVPVIEEDAVHVSIETVVPNSPAALADLQKGDRLIAIGGVKVTSSVHVLKLIKQAGDKVLVYYERPVRHQIQPVGVLQEGFNQLEEPAYMTQPVYEEDSASINTLDSSDGKDMDPELEEQVYEAKLASSDINEESLLTINQSPKRSVANLASKPLGIVSPTLNRKLNLGGLQGTLKPQPKNETKPPLSKSTESPEATQQQGKPLHAPPNRPPVPPRPHTKLTVASSETQCLLDSGDAPIEKPERPPPPLNNGEKAAEKLPVKPMEQNEELEPSNSSKVELKDKVPETSCSTKDNVEDKAMWKSSEAVYRNRIARWKKASSVFETESHHKYLNIALWCKDPFKLGSLICLGHVSLKLEHIALECLSTSSMEYQSTFRLNTPEPKASVSRTALRNLSTHKGFNEKLCYGDVAVNFTYLKEGESEHSSGLIERECSVQEDAQLFPKEEANLPPMLITEVKHNFQDTQFQNPTWCEYCKKKVWTKAASQCMICAYVCHKKCQEKCLAEHPYCVAGDKRVDLEAKSTLNKATGLTRHIINTSSRLLNLRQIPKSRLAEQGPETVEPSPKQTPNTSDNESSDTETYVAGSPSKHPAPASTKLVRKEGGLDDSVFIAVKEIGRDLYRGLPTDERSQKLELMLDKLQQEIDQELEHNNSLVEEEKMTTDARKKSLIATALSKSGERLQALTLLMIHYRAGIEDLESTESSEQHDRNARGSEDSISNPETFDNEIANPMEAQILDEISEEQICVKALP
ncbi:PDZ domain-containing protein 8-like [Polyodon spathula]|uniref:PDZ domain-containing protein 8-like n=1 Tax=Polyodon spathula TaxID=7913 RepID=UPI001B7F611D|nr:PDZ domain-containing protein 8-like [Polyodon spathula]